MRAPGPDSIHLQWTVLKGRTSVSVCVCPELCKVAVPAKVIWDGGRMGGGDELHSAPGRRLANGKWLGHVYSVTVNL